MRNPVGWFEIYVNDMSKAKAFYEAVLQQELTAMDMPENFAGTMEMMSFPMIMEGSGCPGALVRMDGCSGGGGSTIVYFSSADVAVEIGRVAAAGGTVQMEKTSIGNCGFIGLFVDPDGNVVGLHSME